MEQDALQTDGDFVCELMQSGVSLADGFPRLIEFCQSRYPKRDWQKIAAVDLAADIETMVNWLTHLLTSEPPRDNIVAFYFGLYTPTIDDEETCSLSISGSTWFSVETSTWAVWDKDGYHPQHSDPPMNNLNQIYPRWNSTTFDNNSTDPSQWTDTSEYALFLGYAGLMVGELGRRISPQLWLGSANERVLAAGWDEGDIFEVGKITPSGFEKWQPPVYTFEELFEKLQSPDSESRVYAVGQLGKLDDPKALDALMQALVQDSDRIVAFLALQEIERIGDHRAAPALVPSLQHQDRLVREQAARLLREWQGPEAVSDFVEMLKIADHELARANEMRWAAMDALKSRHPPRC